MNELSFYEKIEPS